jgi:hypothetical protein
MTADDHDQRRQEMRPRIDLTEGRASFEVMRDTFTKRLHRRPPSPGNASAPTTR